MRERASNSFDDASAAGAAIEMEDMAMNDDVVPEARSCESLRLIKAFLRLTDPGRRGRVLDLAEQLAEDAGAVTAGSTVAATEASFVESAPCPRPNRMKPNALVRRVPRRNVIHRHSVSNYLVDATFYTLPTGPASRQTR